MFGFNRMVQHALHLMPQTIFLVKGLMAIWHCWTIFCGGTVKEKYYADKPEIIGHLIANICAFENVQENSFDRVRWMDWRRDWKLLDLKRIVSVPNSMNLFTRIGMFDSQRSRTGNTLIGISNKYEYLICTLVYLNEKIGSSYQSFDNFMKNFKNVFIFIV